MLLLILLLLVALDGQVCGKLILLLILIMFFFVYVVFGLLLSTASDGRDKVWQVCDKSETLELSVRAKPRRPTRQTEENNLCFLSFWFHAWSWRLLLYWSSWLKKVCLFTKAEKEEGGWKEMEKGNTGKHGDNNCHNDHPSTFHNNHHRDPSSSSAPTSVSATQPLQSSSSKPIVVQCSLCHSPASYQTAA